MVLVLFHLEKVLVFQYSKMVIKELWVQLVLLFKALVVQGVVFGVELGVETFKIVPILRAFKLLHIKWLVLYVLEVVEIVIILI